MALLVTYQAVDAALCRGLLVAYQEAYFGLGIIMP
jgi:hypothetical protein